MFKFTIREIAMMTAVVAVLFALWTDRRQRNNANERLVKHVEALEARIDAFRDEFKSEVNKDWSLPVTVPTSPGAKILIYRPGAGYGPTSIPIEPVPAVRPGPPPARKLVPQAPPAVAPKVRAPISE